MAAALAAALFVLAAPASLQASSPGGKPAAAKQAHPPAPRIHQTGGGEVVLDEIEVVLYTHPEVKEAAVVAVPDEMIGSRIRAFVTCAEGVSLDQGTLREHCLEKLPRYMVPESIQFMDGLPKTSTGKIDRTLLGQGSSSTTSSPQIG